MKLLWALSILTGSAATKLVHPTYEPFNSSSLDPSSFFEQFLYENLDASPWEPFVGNLEDVEYKGKWEIEEPEKYPGLAGDKGLVMKTTAARYSIAYRFDKPFDNQGKDLVFQFEVKTQDGLECGGAYLKLLDRDFEGPVTKDTPFQVMFGPDKCGANDNVHFIFTRENPVARKPEEKKLTKTPLSRSTHLSALYTLIFRQNLEFEIRIDGQTVKAANLNEKPDWFKPPVTPPKEMLDISDVKPDDWDDDEMIPDESVSKPDDYDQKYLSSMIPDSTKSKPSGWLDKQPKYIADPMADKPAEWDDEEDGEWHAPIIPNPECTVGCGEWKQPKIPNKNYKGPWSPPLIKNPNYKGEWHPRMKPNPDYYEDKTPADLRPIGGIGIEVWSMQKDILFNNIYLGHSVEEAERIGNETFLPKLQEEEKDYKVNKPQPVKAPSPPPTSFDDELLNDGWFNFHDIGLAIRLIIIDQVLEATDFWVSFNNDPVNTLITEPLKAAVYACVFLFVFTFVFGVLNLVFMVASGGAKEPVAPPAEPENVPKIVELDDNDEEVVTTGRDRQPNVRRRG